MWAWLGLVLAFETLAVDDGCFRQRALEGFICVERRFVCESIAGQCLAVRPQSQGGSSRREHLATKNNRHVSDSGGRTVHGRQSRDTNDNLYISHSHSYRPLTWYKSCPRRLSIYQHSSSVRLNRHHIGSDGVAWVACVNCVAVVYPS